MTRSHSPRSALPRAFVASALACSLLACAKHGGAPVEARRDEPATVQGPASPQELMSSPEKEPTQKGATQKSATAAAAAPAEAAKAAPSGKGGSPAELADGVLTIWPLGDSITLGVEGGYRNRLFDLCKDAGIKVDYVGTLTDEWTKVADKQHEGHSGFTIDNAAEHFAAWQKTVKEPEVVLILLGTNNLAWWTNRGPETHVDDLFRLVDLLLGKLPKAKLVVGTIPPQSSKSIEVVKLDRQAMTRDFNEGLRRRIPQHAAFGARVFLADVGGVLTVADTYDGIHPSGPAHNKMADVWYQGLRKALGL